MLCERLAPGRGAGAGAGGDAVDLLTALTSFETYDSLAQTREPAAVCALVLRAARAILVAEPA